MLNLLMTMDPNRKKLSLLINFFLSGKILTHLFSFKTCINFEQGVITIYT